MKTTSRKVLALFLTLLMVVSCIPLSTGMLTASAYTNGKGGERLWKYDSANTAAGQHATLGWRISHAGFIDNTGTTTRTTQPNWLTDLGTQTCNASSYYDFRSGASNSEPYISFLDSFSDYSPQNSWSMSVIGMGTTGEKKSMIFPTRPATVNPGETTGTVQSSTFTFTSTGFSLGGTQTSGTAGRDPTYTSDSGYSPNGKFKLVVNFKYYGINTTVLYSYYQSYLSTYGTVGYSDTYSGVSWNTYLAAMRSAKSMIDGEVDNDNGAAVTQTTVENRLTALKNAVNNLQYLSYTLNAALYSSGEGYTYSNQPATVQYYSNLEFDVNLLTGYTQSVPTVTANGTTYDGVKNGNTYHFTIPFQTTIDSIVVNNVVKNTYTVSVNSGTGYTATPASGTVTHGNNYQFKITVGNAYSQHAPTVKANGTLLGASQSGNTHTYTIGAVSANQTVTVEGLVLNTYTVGYNCGTGTSKNSASATSITHGGTATIKIDVGAAYSQRTPVVTVSNGTLGAGAKSGSTWTYTLSGATANTTVTVAALALNTYAVTVPNGTGYTVSTNGGTVNHNGSFSFNVTLDTAYTQTAPVVKSNGSVLAATQNGNTYSYTINNITATQAVTIDGLAKNTYSVSLPTTDTGAWTTADATGYNHASVVYGNSYGFNVTVARAFTQTTPAVTYNGSPVSATGSTNNADGSITYSYLVNNVTANGTVAVGAMDKNTYPVVLPSGTGYHASYDSSIYDLAAVVDGTDLQFSIVCDEQYNRSGFVVKYNGTVLEPSGGIYTVKVLGEIADGEITVENVKLNDYCIALALDTETGYTIEVADGYNPKKVTSGDDFKFKLFLDPAYSNSTPSVKLSTNGGNAYADMTLGADGYYTIDAVYTDCIVIVEGVVINKYTVDFTDGAGSCLERFDDVEYGSSVSYSETEPSKADEQISTDTVTMPNGDEVTTTVKKVYEFAGWSAETTKVVSDMTVDPIFNSYEVTTVTTVPAGGGDPVIEEGDKVATYYTVWFFNDNGTVIYKENVDKGTAFTGYTATPTKASSNPYGVYTFAGWDTDGDKVVDIAAGESTAIASVSDDTTFTAVFDYSLGSQHVSYYNFDGSELLYSANVNQGEEAVYGKASVPTRIDSANIYTFVGWSYAMNDTSAGTVDKVVVGDSDINLYAAYDAEAIVYSYVYKNAGTALQEGTFNYGDTYKYLGATPTKASTVETAYTFNGWSVAQDGYTTTYDAQFAAAARPYNTNLPAGDATYTISNNAVVAYGDDFSFDVTLLEGYTQTAPVVTAGGAVIAPAAVNGNVYTYTITAEGATVEEVNNALTVDVATTINTYAISTVKGGAGFDGDIAAIANVAYKAGTTFNVNLLAGYADATPVVTADNATVVSVVKNGNAYAVTLANVTADTTVTITPAANVYDVDVTAPDSLIVKANSSAAFDTTYTFTVKTLEGYDQNAPTVTVGGKAVEAASNAGNVYTYTITVSDQYVDEDGNIIVVVAASTINTYKTIIAADPTYTAVTNDVAYQGDTTFTVTLAEGYTDKAPVVEIASGNATFKYVGKTGNTYTYSLSHVTSDVNITVGTEINHYKVTYKNYDGSILDIADVDWGNASVYGGATPVKATDVYGFYTFSKWDIDLSNVKSNLTAIAEYDFEHTHDDPATFTVTVTKENNCGVDGNRHYACSYCGWTYDEVIPATGNHSWDSGKVITPATYTEHGLFTQTCTVCGATRDFYIYMFLIKDQDGKPIAGADAVLTDETGASSNYVSDENGMITFITDADHTYTVTVQKDGYDTITGEITVTDGKISSTELTAQKQACKCFCHKNAFYGKIMRFVCSILTAVFGHEIKCCDDMEFTLDTKF